MNHRAAEMAPTGLTLDVEGEGNSLPPSPVVSSIHGAGSDSEEPSLVRDEAVDGESVPDAGEGNDVSIVLPTPPFSPVCIS